MEQYHIPYDLVLEDGEDELHVKINNDSVFCKYYHEMEELLNESIKDDTLNVRIVDAVRAVYTFAEIAAYREGFKEGIRFLTDLSKNR